MNYRHLSIEERSCIRKYYVDGLSYREIARLIGLFLSPSRHFCFSSSNIFPNKLLCFFDLLLLR